MSAPLLMTKLHVPLPASDLLDRPHLIGRLDESARRKLTLVCAPAGFGKTTVVSQWVRDHSDLPVAWLSLDEGDNDLKRFVRYQVAALQQVDARVGIITQILLETPQRVSSEALLTPLINDLAQLDRPVILILDDYHLIADQQIHDTLNFLIERQPPQLHVVIMSRHDPPLRLGRLRVQGQLEEIRSIDLIFDRAAVGELFGKLMGIHLSSDELAVLEDRTEGWIAGLQLAGLALRGREDSAEFIARFAGDHSYIVDYLGAEVFKRQTDQVRNFLLKTSILPNLTPALCDAVTGQNNGHEILDYLVQANLFLIPLDNQRRWYRYHHLFSDLLLHLLNETHSDHIPELHMRASLWFREQGFVGEAIQHALAAREFSQAAELIESLGMTLVGSGEFETLQHWIQGIPVTFRKERPYLALLLAWGCVMIGDPGDVPPHLDLAAQSVEPMAPNDPVRREIECQIELLRAYVLRSRGNLASALEHTRNARDLLPDDQSFLQCTVNLNLGGNYRLMGNPAAAEEPFRRAAALSNQAAAEYPALAGAGFLANIYLHTGQLRLASRYCQETVESAFARRNYPLPAIAYIYVEQGELLYEQNDLEAAEPVLENAIEIGSTADRVVNVFRAMQLLALTKRALGDATAAAAYTDRVAALFESGKRFLVMRQTEFDYHRVQWSLLHDDLRSALRWAGDYAAHRALSTAWDVMNETSYARVLLASQQLDEALHTLNQCLTLSNQMGLHKWTIQCLILKALCYQVWQDENGALMTLADALTRAEPEGYIRSFVDEGTAMAQLLTAALTHYAELDVGPQHFSAAYASQLLTLIRAETQTDVLLVEALTERETDVLRLLAADLSNQEIADQLVISLGTVKQYNHVIFRKLDVSSRQQAVERARQLHLL